ncbi:MAG: putative toxin-antitoxin system toxin component, PIN family [Nitriliruptorales bacterium]|nr:putative toxin-antitoxin system toxin component, PIN family [Nitriliruptorales bacterium]
MSGDGWAWPTRTSPRRSCRSAERGATAGPEVRVLLDTNVLISALLFGGLPEALLRRGLEGAFVMISSEVLLDELEDKLLQRFEFGRAQSRLVRQELDLASDNVLPQTVPAASRDPDDDHVLAAAVAGLADWIVTGDKDLLVMGRHRGIAIVTPRSFWETVSGA